MSESNQKSSPRQAQTPSPPPSQNVGRIGRFSSPAVQPPEPSDAAAKAANDK